MGKSQTILDVYVSEDHGSKFSVAMIYLVNEEGDCFRAYDVYSHASSWAEAKKFTKNRSKPDIRILS